MYNNDTPPADIWKNASEMSCYGPRWLRTDSNVDSNSNNDCYCVSDYDYYFGDYAPTAVTTTITTSKIFDSVNG